MIIMKGVSRFYWFATTEKALMILYLISLQERTKAVSKKALIFKKYKIEVENPDKKKYKYTKKVKTKYMRIQLRLEGSAYFTGQIKTKS